MQRVDVKLVSAEVAAYNARDEHLEVRILLNANGKDKALIKQLRLQEPAQQAEEILKEIREKVKKTPASDRFITQNDILEGIVHVRWLQDEELLHERLTKFLASLRERMRLAHGKRMSYYDIERNMMNAKTIF